MTQCHDEHHDVMMLRCHPDATRVEINATRVEISYNKWCSLRVHHSATQLPVRYVMLHISAAVVSASISAQLDALPHLSVSTFGSPLEMGQKKEREEGTLF